MSIKFWTPLKRNWSSKPPRRRAALAGTALAGAIVALIVHAAVLTDSFEIDQDASNGAALGDDWDTLLANGNPSGAFVFDVDPVNSSADDNFNQGGSKDERDISAAGITKTYWLNTQTTPPDKDDLEHAFAASYTAANGDLLVYFGADRFSNSGDAAVGFWFFQNEVSDNNNSGVFSGVHKVGDILITSDFRQGGGVGVINVLKWVGGTNPLKLLVSKTLAQGQQIPDVFCNDQINGTPTIPANTVCATSNRSPKPVPNSWTGGYVFKGGGNNNMFPTGTFFEGGVNISALFQGSSLPCFTSFLAMTRTSASTTAQLKDYVSGAFPVCGIEVGKACNLNSPPTVNNDGVSIHTSFNVPIHNTGSSTVYSVKLAEDALSDADNLDCKITAIGNTTGLSLPFNGVTSQDVVASIAPGGTVNVVVECNSLDNPMLNTVTASATTGANATGTLLTASHTTIVDQGETCAATVNPSLTVTKSCVAPVTFDPVTLKPHICVNIVVTNTSAEKLIEGTLIDDKLGTLYGAGGTLGTSFSLNPGAVLNVQNRCYDSFLQDDDQNNLPGEAMFSDTVSANARGQISGVMIGRPDDVPAVPVPWATAHCPFCPHDE
jgi:hypothetical protein